MKNKEGTSVLEFDRLLNATFEAKGQRAFGNDKFSLVKPKRVRVVPKRGINSVKSASIVLVKRIGQ